ncbi:hypothetical protein WHR41_09398 [Cladosporium halotolerans]|uniref:DNA-directed RNA polymerase subunit n=1 Tax=Cladosporium halotolerans TaxID=1052096 RepID=A0AB34KEX4_9PEZI
MSFIGLLFCTDCGNLLPRANRQQMPHIICDVCAKSNSNQWPDEQTTVSRPEAFPSSLRRKLLSNTIEISQDVANSQQTANEECPRCHNPQLRFSEAQLRSADEGSTIFYTCPKCDYKFNTNN